MPLHLSSDSNPAAFGPECATPARMKSRGLLRSLVALPVIVAVAGAAPAANAAATARSNILWIVVDDMSADWGCYRSTAVPTPNIDRLAAEGALFTRCFATAPVCSPSRSALITGMYQASLGAHHHNSSLPGSEIYLPAPIRLLPAILKEHGYYTCNGEPDTDDARARPARPGKTDYNFVWDPEVYDGIDWSGRAPGQPFFAQIQLSGGKFREARVPTPADPASVVLPPYYADDPVLRQDWAEYLNSVVHLDRQVGAILDRLQREGIAGRTVVALWTDHGISHVRGKQFCYDEGLRTPLIIRWPGVIEPGTVRDDLVQPIDLTASTLEVAGVPVPEYLHGRPLFGPGYAERRFVFGARDRCDETLDCIRAVRDRRYLYLRNFFPERPYLQPNRYKDGKAILKRMRELHAAGKLTAAQTTIFADRRPSEELYDTVKDPHQIHNLADSPGHRDVLLHMRRALLDHMRETEDLGLIPEFELVSQNRTGGAYGMLRRHEDVGLLDDILALIVRKERANKEDAAAMAAALRDERPSIRWWAARGLAGLGGAARAHTRELVASLDDPKSGVRVEVARALVLLGETGYGLPVLRAGLSDRDQIVRHYAALALEDIGVRCAAPALDDLKAALRRPNQYEYVLRVGQRLVAAIEREVAGERR